MFYINKNRIYEYEGNLYTREELRGTHRKGNMFFGCYEWQPIKRILGSFYRKSGQAFILDDSGFNKLK